MTAAGTDQRGPILARWARAHLCDALGGAAAERPTGAWCDEPGATFVSLHWKETGDLQGCIGTLEADRAIVDDVAHNAVAAGTRDPRFPPCTLDDVDRLDVEMSILSPLEPIPGPEQIRAGVDGIVLIQGHRRATFLPAVWEQLPTVERFLEELRRKAGLPRGHAGEVQLLRYTVDHYVDPAP